MKFQKNWLVYSIAGFALVLSGCFGSTDERSEDSANPLSDDPTLPFIEATIEYPGPHEKWAGPQNFSIKVVNWSAGGAKVTIHPPLSKNVSHKMKHAKQSEASGLSTEAARADFARLHTALQSDESGVHGCLSPIKVKLLRADGALVERQACRTQPGWPRVAHEIANHWIELAVFPQKGAQKEPEKEPKKEHKEEE
jgi:hypothetical protein